MHVRLPLPVCAVGHHQAKLFCFALNWCETSQRPFCWGISMWFLVPYAHLCNRTMDVAGVWTIYRGKANVSDVSTLIPECKSSCVENQSGSGVKPVLLSCSGNWDAAAGMKTVGMQKLPCLENKTSHEMERNNIKNFSIPCLKEVGKDFAAELSWSCSQMVFTCSEC